MTPDELNNVEQTTESNSIDYINAINKLKQNTVSRESYDKLRAENKQLLDTLVNGGQINQITSIEQPKVDELNEALFGNQNISNLEYCEKALKLREAILKEGGRDPFLTFGHNVNVDDNDIAAANRVAAGLKEIIDYADGNTDIFTMELQRRMIDVVPFRR